MISNLCKNESFKSKANLLSFDNIHFLTLPCPPNRANDSSGWTGRAFGKQKYYKQCAGDIYQAKASFSDLPWGKVEWCADVEVSRYMDADNLAALMKWPLDLLVDSGILLSD